MADALAFEALEDLALGLCAVGAIADADAVVEDLLQRGCVRYRHLDERGGLAGFLVDDADRAEGMLVSELAEHVVVVHCNARLDSFYDDDARRVLEWFDERLDTLGEGIGGPVGRQLGVGSGVISGDDEQVAFERGELNVELAIHAAVYLLGDRDCGAVDIRDGVADLQLDCSKRVLWGLLGAAAVGGRVTLLGFG